MFITVFNIMIKNSNNLSINNKKMLIMVYPCGETLQAFKNYVTKKTFNKTWKAHEKADYKKVLYHSSI